MVRPQEDIIQFQYHLKVSAQSVSYSLCKKVSKTQLESFPSFFVKFTMNDSAVVFLCLKRQRVVRSVWNFALLTVTISSFDSANFGPVGCLVAEKIKLLFTLLKHSHNEKWRCCKRPAWLKLTSDIWAGSGKPRLPIHPDFHVYNNWNLGGILEGYKHFFAKNRHFFAQFFS